mmetsp:Transcript_1023/g.3594  ORF Transcript_1023/g.3594 Transcript_1023/m.3594 type:complete len:232 (+) Transcript_1023:51-746(+)
MEAPSAKRARVVSEADPGLVENASSPEQLQAATSGETQVPPRVHPLFQRGTRKAKNVYLIRHGESAGYNYKEDVELTRAGVEQAAMLQQRLADLKAEVILVSPLRRALHTCQLSSGVGQTIVEVLPILAEQLSTPGDIGSHPRKLMTQFPMYAEELLKLSSEWQKDVCGPHRPSRSCESLAHLRTRVGKFRQQLMSRREQTIVVIGHSSFFRELASTKRRLQHCEIYNLKV